jgi:hypothetical protein
MGEQKVRINEVKTGISYKRLIDDRFHMSL